MKNSIHIFNPSHEMALAHAENYYQPKQRIALMEQQLSLLPLWWSREGDEVLVPDARKAERWVQQLPVPVPKVRFVELADVLTRQNPTWEVWGWNRLLRRQLQGCQNLPDDTFLDTIRMLSSRETAVRVLQSFPKHEGLTGAAYYCTTPQQVAEAWEKCPYYVLKSLWSSSGRGVMLMQHAEWEQSRQLALSFLKNGGGLVIEPMYDKIQDFAMEFTSDGHGQVRFGGYSFFTAEYGRYAANIVMDQQQLEEMILVPKEVLEFAKHHLEQELGRVIGTRYQGPLGVDMMVVRPLPSPPEGGNLNRETIPVAHLHPCVEINLRRNMGWLAIDLYKNYLAPGLRGKLYTDYSRGNVLWNDHQKRLQESPVILQEGRIISGYLPLTIVKPDTQYRIRLEVDSFKTHDSFDLC